MKLIQYKVLSILMVLFIPQFFQAQTAIEWREKVNVEVLGTELKNHLGQGNWDAGAYSLQSLYPNVDGSFEFVVQQTNKIKIIGFSVFPNVDEQGIDIEYGLRLNNDGKLYYTNNGVVIGTSIGNYAVGETLKVSREGNQLKIYQNNVEINSATINPAEQLIIDVGFKDQSGSFNAVTSSFDEEILQANYSITAVNYSTGIGGINLSVSGGSATPYTYDWTGPGITNSGSQNQSSLAAGTYQLVVTDANGFTITSNIGLGYLPEWVDGINMHDVGGIVKKQSAETIWDEDGIISSNILYPNTDCWAEYTTEDRVEFKLFSFSEVPEIDWTERNDIEYGMFLTGRGQLFYFENGAYARIGAYAKGDILRIEKLGSTLYYKKNGAILRQVAIDGSKSYTLRVNMRDGDAQFDGIRTSSKDKKIDITPDVTPIAFDGSAAGVANVLVTGGVPPYTYSWSTGESTANVSGLTTSVAAQLTITDAQSTVNTFDLGLGYELSWNAFANASYTNGVLSKTGGALGWDAGACAQNTLFGAQDGWVEHTVETANDVKILALTKYPHNGLENIYVDYGVNFNSNQKLYARWLNPLTQIEIGTYAIGDVIRIERVGATMFWKRNGLVLHQRTIDPNENLIIQARFKTANASFSKLRSSFKAVPLTVQFSPGPYNYATQTVDAVAMANGGVPPYQYDWSGGQVSSNANQIGVGIHQVTVTDDEGNSITEEIAVGHRILWEELTNMNKDGDGIEKTSVNGFDAQAISKNSLPVGVDGWVEFTAESNTKNKILSLKEEPHNGFSITDQAYGFYLRSDGELRVREMGVNTTIGFYHAGDRLRIERVGTTINYVQNGTVIRSLPNQNHTEALVIDALLFYQNDRFDAVRASFSRPKLTATANTTDITRDDGLGSHELTITGGTEPVRIYWGDKKLSTNDFTQAINSLDGLFNTAPNTLIPVSYEEYLNGFNQSLETGLRPGVHPVLVEDAWGAKVELNLAVGFIPTHSSLSGVTQNGNRYTKTATDGWGNSEVIFANAIEADGWMRFTAGQVDREWIAGFVPVGASGYGKGSLSNAFYVKDEELYVQEAGVNYPMFRELEANDLFHIERKAGVVTYHHNGELIHTSYTSSSGALRMGMEFYENGTFLDEMKTSGDVWVAATPDPMQFIANDPDCIERDNGSIQVINENGNSNFPNHQFTWSTGARTPNLTGLSKGKYTVTVTYTPPFGNSVSSTKTFVLDYPVKWTGFVNGARQHSNFVNDLINTDPSTIGEAHTRNILEHHAQVVPTDEDYFTFKVDYNAHGNTSFYSMGAMLSNYLIGSTHKAPIVFAILGQNLMLINLSGGSNPPYFQAGGPTVIISPRTIHDGDIIKVIRKQNMAYQLQVNNVPVYSNIVSGTVNDDFQLFAYLHKSPNALVNPRTNHDCHSSATPVFGTLKKKTDASYYKISEDKLRFKYKEEYATELSDELDYRIYTLTNHEMLVASAAANQSTQYVGPVLNPDEVDNWFTIDLSSFALNGGLYLLEVVDQKGEKSYLKFKL